MHDRYSRQILLREIGSDGQKKIGESKVVVVGCGALGTHASSMLVRAGVGETIVVDPDRVDITNLHRQTLFGEDAVGKPKAETAQGMLRSINSEVGIKGIVARVTEDNVEDIIAGADAVIDGTDNMTARFIVNDACVKLMIPWVYGGAVGTSHDRPANFGRQPAPLTGSQRDALSRRRKRKDIVSVSSFYRPTAIR